MISRIDLIDGGAMKLLKQAFPSSMQQNESFLSNCMRMIFYQNFGFFVCWQNAKLIIPRSLVAKWIMCIWKKTKNRTFNQRMLANMTILRHVLYNQKHTIFNVSYKWILIYPNRNKSFLSMENSHREGSMNLLHTNFQSISSSCKMKQ